MAQQRAASKKIMSVDGRNEQKNTVVLRGLLFEANPYASLRILGFLNLFQRIFKRFQSEISVFT